MGMVKVWTAQKIENTYTDNTPLLDIRVLGRRSLDKAQRLGHKAGRTVLAEKCANLLLLLLIVRREQVNGQRLAVKRIWHENGIFLVVVGGGQDISALDGLVKETKDIHDDEDALGRRVDGSGHIGLAVVNRGVIALLLVA